MKITKMAPLKVLFCTSFVIALAFMKCFVNAERVFKVGDGFGWQEPAGGNSSALYSQWAGRNRFQVGDSLLFEYKNDSVLEVEKGGYYHCDTSKPIVAFNNGNSVFKFDRPGPFYYISGSQDHCKNGQRLLIEVMGLHHHSPPFIAVPPGYLVPSPQPNSAISSPQPNSAISSVLFTVGSLSMVLMTTLVALLWSAP